MSPRELLHKLGDGELVVLADVVEEAEGVVLHHHVVSVHCLLRLVHPPLGHVQTRLGQVLQHRVIAVIANTGQLAIFCNTVCRGANTRLDHVHASGRKVVSDYPDSSCYSE